MIYKFNPRITVGYARVSTRDQFVKGNALDRYIEDMIAAGITDYFTDVESGGSESRDGFNRTLEACRSWASIIAIPDFTRLQRSMIIWEKIRPELVSLGVEICDLYTGRSIGFRTAEDIRQTQVKTADAEFLRNFAAEQAIKGFERNRQKGLSFQAAFGLKRINKKIYINNDRYRDSNKTYSEVALELVDIFLDRQSLSMAVRIMCDRYGHDRVGEKNLDFPRSHNSLKRWLENPLLRGHQPYLPKGVGHRKTIFKEFNAIPRTLYHNHDALFSPELQSEIDRTIAICSVGQKPISSRKPLSGLLYCGICGDRVYVHGCNKRLSDGTVKNYNYLLCRSADPPEGGIVKCCHRPQLSLSEAIDQVIYAICDRALEIAEWASEEIGDQEPTEITDLKQAIAKLESLGDPDLEDAIVVKKNRLSELQERQKKSASYRGKVIEQLTGVAGDVRFWQSLETADLVRLLPEFVKRVDIYSVDLRVQFLV